MNVSQTVKRKFGFLLLASLLTLFGLMISVQSQRRSSPGFVTESSDVVFAIVFSPDAKLLAIARGANDPRQRFGRIELWNTSTGNFTTCNSGFRWASEIISFSPDGKTLVSGSIEFHSSKFSRRFAQRFGDIFGELKWWDRETGN
jgi:WD40 repeat protein